MLIRTYQHCFGFQLNAALPCGDDLSSGQNISRFGVSFLLLLNMTFWPGATYQPGGSRSFFRSTVMLTGTLSVVPKNAFRLRAPPTNQRDGWTACKKSVLLVCVAGGQKGFKREWVGLKSSLRFFAIFLDFLEYFKIFFFQ